MEAAKNVIGNIMGYNKDDETSTSTSVDNNTSSSTAPPRPADDNTTSLGSGNTSSHAGSASAHQSTTTGTGGDLGATTGGTGTSAGTRHTPGESSTGAGHTSGTSGATTGTTTAAADTTTSGSTDSGEHKSGFHLPNPLHHHKSHETSSDSLEPSEHSHSQTPDQGRDPAVIGNDSEGRRLTGVAEPGSHSAVFGLTPSGEKITDTKPGSGVVKPARDLGKSGGSAGDGDENNDTSSRAPAGGEKLSEQMHNPRDQGPKGLERKEPITSIGGSDSDKPGAGGVGLQQGTGDV